MKKVTKKQQPVMDQVAMREFDHQSVPRLPEYKVSVTLESTRILAALKPLKGLSNMNRRKQHGRVVRSLHMKNPPHPGWVVRVDCLQPHGLTVTKGAKILGVSRSALSRLVNESADLSWDMAIPLAKAFGGTPEGGMRLQLEHDAALVRARAITIEVTPFRGEDVPT